ncbi:MAG: flagellar hook-length control protein FliK, partial [Deltaproteobacteria bacterium]|nr:flagellar hook-length control protein FliK [Deltaproteobacteria bacterium]
DSAAVSESVSQAKSDAGSEPGVDIADIKDKPFPLNVADVDFFAAEPAAAVDEIAVDMVEVEEAAVDETEVDMAKVDTNVVDRANEPTWLNESEIVSSASAASEFAEAADVTVVKTLNVEGSVSAKPQVAARDLFDNLPAAQPADSAAVSESVNHAKSDAGSEPVVDIADIKDKPFSLNASDVDFFAAEPAAAVDETTVDETAVNMVEVDTNGVDRANEAAWLNEAEAAPAPPAPPFFASAPVQDSAEALNANSAGTLNAGDSAGAPVPVETQAPFENIPAGKQNLISGDLLPRAAADLPGVVAVNAAGSALPNQKKVWDHRFENYSLKTNPLPSAKGSASVPEGNMVQAGNDFAADEGKGENSGGRSGSETQRKPLTGEEMGILHLQGRSLETQTVFTSGKADLPLQNFSGFIAENVENTEFSLAGAGKKIIDGDFASALLTQVGNKEKYLAERVLSRSHELLTGSPESLAGRVFKGGFNVAPAKPLPVSDENLIEQIKSGMVRQVKGQQTLTIRLWPESMGKVEVKLVLREREMSATFTVEQSDVKDAMLRKLDSLRDSLSLRGIDVKEIDIKVAPPKSGDGPSVAVGDHHQAGSDTWRQNRQGGFAQSDHGPAYSSAGMRGRDDSSLVSESQIDAGAAAMVQVGLPGSLHIMA